MVIFLDPIYMYGCCFSSIVCVRLFLLFGMCTVVVFSSDVCLRLLLLVPKFVDYGGCN